MSNDGKYEIGDVIDEVCAGLDIPVFDKHKADSPYDGDANLGYALAGHALVDDASSLAAVWDAILFSEELDDIKVSDVVLESPGWRAAARAWKAGRL